jgi:hypothetical protein
MLICKCPHCGEEHWCNHADLGTEFKCTHKCPHCGEEHWCNHADLGTEFKCTHCGRYFRCH